ncbi:glycosyltransferase family 2 protein [Syntrophomonas palmitatica]|uniref:glycosyltransferase family 2 protein n=1 Tax=Syntrophomonas palmitatica TaxID=402877 RepID=UPI0006D20636|nr:glycosyltransferase family 2 protein [Syntrophomonas palmitatica]
MQESNTYISVVIPVYNCAKSLNELYIRLEDTLSNISPDFEIIFVNDCSPQHDWQVITELASKDDRVKGINLSRNFGQHNAITAGLDNTSGEWVVVMDGDLQDQPEEIIKLYNKAQEGYDIVFGRRYDRQDIYFKKLMSRTFNKVFEYLADTTTDHTIANFSICNAKVIDSFRMMREKNRSYQHFIKWTGYNLVYIDIEHASRPEGKSSYTFRKRLELATQIIVAHSNKPLRLSIGFGFLMTVLSVVYAVYLVLRYLLLAKPPAGWTSVMVSLYFLCGLLFANFGIVGLYIGKIFDETKNRPLYLIDDRINI